MKKELDIKLEINKLDIKYAKEKQNLVKKCKHIWKENGHESNKYSGTQYYKCSICGTEKGEGF